MTAKAQILLNDLDQLILSYGSTNIIHGLQIIFEERHLTQVPLNGRVTLENWKKTAKIFEGTAEQLDELYKDSVRAPSVFASVGPVNVV